MRNAPFITVLSGLVLILAMSLGLAEANTGVAPLPPIEEVIKRALERAEVEAKNDEEFKKQYYFVRSRKTEIRDSDGDIKKLKTKISTNDPTAYFLLELAEMKEERRRKLHSPKYGANESDSDAAKKYDRESNLKFSKEAVKRYDFKIVGREITNGCSLLIVDFAPKTGKLPEKDLRDRIVNRMAGRIWLDERDYAVKKCAIRLTRNLSIVGGIVGEAQKFHFTFDRERTEDGLWYVREFKWHLEGRQVVVQREADYHETRTDVRKYVPNDQ